MRPRRIDTERERETKERGDAGGRLIERETKRERWPDERFSNARYSAHTETAAITLHDSFQLPSIRYLFAPTSGQSPLVYFSGRCCARLSLGPSPSEYQEFRRCLDRGRG